MLFQCSSRPVQRTTNGCCFCPAGKEKSRLGPGALCFRLPGNRKYPVSGKASRQHRQRLCCLESYCCFCGERQPSTQSIAAQTVENLHGTMRESTAATILDSTWALCISPSVRVAQNAPRTLTHIAPSILYRNPGRFVSGLTALVPNAVFKSPYLITAGGRHLLASFALISYSLSLSHTASTCPTVVETVVSMITKTPLRSSPSSGAVCQRDGGHRIGAGSMIARKLSISTLAHGNPITTAFTHRCRKFHHLSGA